MLATFAACVGPLLAGADAVRSTDLILHSFDQADGFHPMGRLLLASDGSLYGTTNSGGGGSCSANGNSGCGVIFKLDPASGVYTVLHRFQGSPDGAQPFPLIEGNDGNFYGVAELGEDRGPAGYDAGTIFRITPDGTFTVLHQFLNSPKNYPTAGLTLGSGGDLFGTTRSGGDRGGAGTFFKITTGGAFTILNSFAVGGPEPSAPDTALALGADGNFYGTSSYGGTTNNGTVYRVTPAGVFTTLQSFPTTANIDASGGGLLQASDGDLYGARGNGGENSLGSVFRMKFDGTQVGNYSLSDHGVAFPKQSLVEGEGGALYGAAGGGKHGLGGLYRITTSGVVTPLLSFEGGVNHGANPTPLTKGANGVFYGMTYDGGANAGGTIYRLATVPLEPPTNLSASIANHSITLNWTAAEGADSYSVFQGLSPTGEGSTPVQTGIIGTTVTLGGLSNGVRYYYRVASANSTGLSSGSSEVSAVPFPPLAPPNDIRTVAGDGQVTLNWTTSEGAIGYNIYLGLAPGAVNSSPILQHLPGNSVTVGDLINGQTYYFKVAAVSSSEISSLSAEVSATPSNSAGGGGSPNIGTLLLMAGLAWGRRNFSGKVLAKFSPTSKRS